MPIVYRLAPGRQLATLRLWWAQADGAIPGEAAGAGAVFSRRQRIALLVAFAAIVMLRLPRAWAHGRFLDEEGVIFLAYAWHHPAGDALWRSFGGYLNVAANGITLLAARLVRSGLLPLEQAPYLTMAMALGVQLLPAAMILAGRGAWLAGRPAVLAALAIIAMAPMTEEVFFNVLHIQFHLALAAALVLALDVPAGRAGRIGYAAILLVAPLCGPGAIILWPFFVLRWLLEGGRQRLLQTIVFGAGIIIQMAAFFTPSPVRGQILDPVTLAAIMFVRLAGMPVMVWKPGRLARWTNHAYLGGDAIWWLIVAAGVAYLALLVVLALRNRRGPAVWLVVPALAIATLSFGGGMINSASREWFSVGAGERYNFLPIVLVSLGLIALARSGPGGCPRLCTAVVALTLLAGVVSYVKPIDEIASGPAWPVEVARWRGDRDHPLASWPADWAIDLSDRDRKCLPPTVPEAAGDPSYCEGHWLARVRAAIARDRAK